MCKCHGSELQIHAHELRAPGRCCFRTVTPLWSVQPYGLESSFKNPFHLSQLLAVSRNVTWSCGVQGRNHLFSLYEDVATFSECWLTVSRMSVLTQIHFLLVLRGGESDNDFYMKRMTQAVISTYGVHACEHGCRGVYRIFSDGYTKPSMHHRESLFNSAWQSQISVYSPQQWGQNQTPRSHRMVFLQNNS